MRYVALFTSLCVLLNSMQQHSRSSRRLELTNVFPQTRIKQGSYVKPINSCNKMSWTLTLFISGVYGKKICFRFKEILKGKKILPIDSGVWCHDDRC